MITLGYRHSNRNRAMNITELIQEIKMHTARVASKATRAALKSLPLGRLA